MRLFSLSFIWLFLGLALSSGIGASEPTRTTCDQPQEQVVLDFDSTWKYWDRNENPGKNWHQPEFDDSKWPAGQSLLGYGNSDKTERWPIPGIRTELAPNHLTYLFRTEFDFVGELKNRRLRLDSVIDDAAIIYLNGKEIGRTKGAPDRFKFGANANTTIGTPALKRDSLVVDDVELLPGKNLVAVALFNCDEESSDICLGLKLLITEMPTAPRALFLTWQRDPTSTMTVIWHGEPNEQGAILEFAPAEFETDQTLKSETTWQSFNPQTKPMVFSQRTMYSVELTGLQSDSAYMFRIVYPQGIRRSDAYWFRTMPARCDDPQRPVRIAFGGDVRHRKEWMEATNRAAANLEPDAVVWTGDLAYANGLERNLHLWDEFFSACLNTLVTDNRRVIPMIVGIGNHEVQGHAYWGNNRGRDAYRDADEFRASIAPFFYNLFPFPSHPGYGVLDFGDYLSLIILDTDHTTPVEGKQTEWLKACLEQRKSVTHIVPCYHTGAWPSVRDPSDETAVRIRQHWLPLFENSTARVCFEHHDHAYKRTVPILREKLDPAGITYMGDGAWGVTLRIPRSPADTWYLERSEAVRHFILATFSGSHLDLKTIDSEGRLVDHFIPPPRTPVPETKDAK